jgi:hypothetical protein
MPATLKHRRIAMTVPILTAHHKHAMTPLNAGRKPLLWPRCYVLRARKC